MRVEVVDGEGLTEQARAYAEYRLFATLARFGRAVVGVRVTINRREHRDHAHRFACSVSVQLDPSGSAIISAQGPHPHRAIDRAAGRIGQLVDKRIGRRLSS
jgi:ribosome-associated translation inhibitor RaiA